MTIRKDLYIMLFVAVVTSLLTACSQSETVTTYEKEAVKQKTVSNGPIPIDFNTYTPERATTRTENTDITPAYLANQGFSVFAFHTGENTFAYALADNNIEVIPNLMYNQQVTGVTGANGIAWRYFPLKYWPKDGDHVTFFAYGTYASATQNSQNNAYVAKSLDSGIIGISGNGHRGVPYLLYDLGDEADASAMRDLLIATPVYTTAAQDVINFSFTRFMSAIGFKVSGVYDTKTSTVNAIDANSFIRIEKISAEVILPKGRVKISLDPNSNPQIESGDNLYTDSEYVFEGETGVVPQTTSESVVFTLQANNIFENLKYRSIPSEKAAAYAEAIEGGTTEAEAEEAAEAVARQVAAEMLTYGVGRVRTETQEENLDTHEMVTKVAYEPDANLKLPIQDTNGDDQLFYFFPVSGSKTFTITVKYHVFTKDPRMKYGLSDTTIEITKQKQVTLTNAVGSLLWFNLQLGLDEIKITVDETQSNRFWNNNGESTNNYTP